MKINTKYNINQKVYIPELKLWGKILSIYINKSLEPQYNTRFFNVYDPKEVYFLEDELSLEENKTEAGFKNE